MRRLLWAIAVLGLVGLALGATGCGKKKKAAAAAGKKGGTIQVVGVGPDQFDPVMFQTVQANSALHLVYTPLLSYKDATGTDGSTLVPGIADSVPTPTNGGKSYVFHVRPGLKYSDGEPVKASDFDNVIRRMLFLGAPFSSFYFPIKGAEAYASAKKQNAPLPGIKANDSTNTITVTLTKPDTRFLYAVALANVGLTPKSKSPFKVLNSSPPPGVGPYKMQVLSRSPTHGHYILTKNPNFNIPTIAPGKLDKIDAHMTTNVPKMTQDVVAGRMDYMTEDPVGDLLPQVETKYKSRFKIGAGYPNTYYFFLNTTIPPFNNVKARQAVNYAIDSRALQRIFGGRLTPGCTLLPPGIVGYKEITPCPWGDPNGAPQIAKAKALVKSAGLTGTPVTMWTNTKDPRPAIGDYMRDTLNQIGFKASVRTLDQTVYFATIGQRKSKAQIGFDDWFQDYPHPGDFFGSLLTTAAAKASPSFNNGFVSDPHIDSMVDKLDASPPASVADQWSALDKYVNDPSHAYIAPYGHEADTAFYSAKMNVSDCSGYPHPVFRVDWSLLCLK